MKISVSLLLLYIISLFSISYATAADDAVVNDEQIKNLRFLSQSILKSRLALSQKVLGESESDRKRLDELKNVVETLNRRVQEKKFSVNNVKPNRHEENILSNHNSLSAYLIYDAQSNIIKHASNGGSNVSLSMANFKSELVVDKKEIKNDRYQTEIGNARKSLQEIKSKLDFEKIKENEDVSLFVRIQNALGLSNAEEGKVSITKYKLDVLRNNILQKHTNEAVSLMDGLAAGNRDSISKLDKLSKRLSLYKSSSRLKVESDPTFKSVSRHKEK